MLDKLKFAKFLYSCNTGPSTYKGEELSSRDSFVVRCALMLWVGVVRSCVGVENNANEGRIVQLLKSCSTVDLFELLDGLGALDSWLVQSVEFREIRKETELKSVINVHHAVAEPLRILKSLLAPHWRAWIRSSDVEGFRACHQVFAALSRLNLEKKSLAEVAYTKWCDSEIAVAKAGMPSDVEKNVISEWFPLENACILYDWMSPHHSSGSTCERVSNPAEKPLLMGLDANLRTFLKVTGWDDLVQEGLMQSFVPRIAGQQAFAPIPTVGDSEPYHLVIFVAKNWKTYRVVSMEPIAYMFFQQGASVGIQRYLKSRISPVLSRMYCVNTEEENRAAAQRGSIDGSIATIDWSSASDLVAYRYMASLTEGSGLSPFVRMLRTKYAKMPGRISEDLWDESVYAVDKMAPMGSAVCFPLESLFFCTVLFSTYLQERWKYTVSERKRMLAAMRVYGDDCTVPVELVQPFLTRMEEIGAQVNMTKSFFNSGSDQDFYRESCGGEYLNGIDVTPWRLPRKFGGFTISSIFMVDGDWDSATELAQLISLANDLYDLPWARYVVIYHLVSVGQLPLFFDETGERGLRSSSPTNFHLRKRYNTSFQRYEVEALQTVRVSKGYYTLLKNGAALTDDGRLVYSADYQTLPDEVRLFEYLRQSEMSTRNRLIYPEDSLQLKLDPHSFTTLVHLAWVEDPYDGDVS